SQTMPVLLDRERSGNLSLCNRSSRVLRIAGKNPKDQAISTCSHSRIELREGVRVTGCMHRNNQRVSRKQRIQKPINWAGRCENYSPCAVNVTLCFSGARSHLDLA